MKTTMEYLPWTLGFILSFQSIAAFGAIATPIQTSLPQSGESQQCSAVRSPGGCTKPILGDKKPPQPPRQPQ